MMIKNKRNILIVLFPILIIISFVYFFSYRQINKEEVQSTQVTQVLPVTSNMVPPEIEAKPLSGNVSFINTKIEKTEEQERVNLIVLDKEYEVGIKRNDTVYHMMENLQKENNFSFNYKEYPSLGIFINEINGVKGEKSKYWIYSVNGQEASVGVSKYVLKGGDVIKWELK